MRSILCLILIGLLFLTLIPSTPSRAVAASGPPSPGSPGERRMLFAQSGYDDSEFLFVGPPTVSLETYQSVYCQPRSNGVSAACPYAPQMYQMLVAAGIDPVIEMAFAAKETEFGTTGPGRDPQRNIHNIACNGWDHGTCEGPYHYRFSTYPSYLHGIHAWIHLMLHRGTYVDAGNMTFRQVIPIYAPPIENDTELYINQVESMARGWRGWDATQGFSTWRSDITDVPEVAHGDPRFDSLPPPTPFFDDPHFFDSAIIPDYGGIEPELGSVEPPPVLDDPNLPQGATLAVDNTDATFNNNQGTWEYKRCGLQGDHLATTSTSDVSQSDSRASWSALSLQPGIYEVQVYIPECGNGEATTSARYAITHDGGQETVVIDQQAHIGQWVSLGSYFFGARLSPVVEINNQTGDDARDVRVDAIAWILGEDTAAPLVTLERLIQMEHGYSVHWHGDDDQSGIARYEVQIRKLPNGRWRPWLYATTRTQAVRIAPPGEAIAFRVRARDRSGNQGEWSNLIDTSQAEAVIGAPILGETAPHNEETADPMSQIEARGGAEQEVSVVTNGGNLRTAPRIAPETLIMEVCPGDELVVLGQQQDEADTWLHVRITSTAADCVKMHAATGTEGWLSSTLVDQY